MYSVAGRTTATTAVANHAVTALWNPHGSQRIKVTRFAVVAVNAPAASTGHRLVRITTRGTPNSTVTPNLANDSRGALAPPSGVLLDLGAYSVEPTISGADIGPGWTLAAVAASGLVWPMNFEIGPGTGLAWVQSAAVATPICGVTFEFLEDW